ncbi:TraY domain-containing protein [Vibrio tapetis subsp. quintayensis]|uniref:TraY domain-containing protein n=1 Tax=Vibrio tapetis TaxID=52443 RepID=UPI0025B5D12D|nr:TraY domain-containing protein [Vibrio tapetis]MDN3683248.1 TraY domain-containing protein [Vibrio tapetis subsp. quintayensis]
MNANDPLEDEMVVALVLKGVALKRFKESAAASNRSYRGEAKVRMEDHLQQYESIAAVGNKTER